MNHVGEKTSETNESYEKITFGMNYVWGKKYTWEETRNVKKNHTGKWIIWENESCGKKRENKLIMWNEQMNHMWNESCEKKPKRIMWNYQMNHMWLEKRMGQEIYCMNYMTKSHVKNEACENKRIMWGKKITWK